MLAALAAALPSHATELDLLSIGARTRVSEERVLGREQPLSFDEHSVMATWQLPWNGPSWTSWETRTRLLGSIGMLRGPGDNTVVASAIPALAVVHRNLGLAIDAGVGLAVLGKHDYGDQDYGGPLQFALTFGVSMPVWRQVGLGYRFMHYSDAGAYGGHSIGADFHMLELTYFFR